MSHPWLFQLGEKISSVQEKLDAADQKLQQTQRNADVLPTVEAELAQRLQALSQVRGHTCHVHTYNADMTLAEQAELTHRQQGV